MNTFKKFSRLIAEVDGEFVLADTPKTAPMNTKRNINTTKLCENVREAKDFYFFQEDLPATFKAFPNVRLYIYQFTETDGKLTYDKFLEHRSPNR